MLNHGLLVCSFLIRKKYVKDEIYALNADYQYDDKLYHGIIEMFCEFFSNYKEFHDDEKLMKMFSVDQDSIKIEEKPEYFMLSGIIRSGAYGIESQLTNRTTNKVTYKRGKDDADIKNFSFMMVIPKDAEEMIVKKGILLFETIGPYGVKTITTKNIKGFFSEKFGLTVETRSISVRLFMERLLKDENLGRITLIKNRVSKDSSDNMFLTVGREETTYVKPTLKDSWISQVLEHIDGNAQDDIFEINDEVYNDIKFTFSQGGRTKTVRLKDIDKFSMVEEVPPYVYEGNGINRDRLIGYMEETAKGYMNKLVVTQCN